MKPLWKTVYKLSWGSSRTPEQSRYFEPHQLNDAVTHFGQYVTEINTDPLIYTGHVKLERLPDGHHPTIQSILGWTKTSHEKETCFGEVSLEHLLSK